MKHNDVIIKKLITVCLVLALLFSGNMSLALDGIFCRVNAESVFVFNGNNAADYNGQSIIEFDVQTLDLTDEQVKLLMDSCSVASLEQAIFKRSVTVIGKNVFQNCYALKKVDFSQAPNLKIIEDHAFKGCISLDESVYRPSVTAITAPDTVWLPSGLSYFGEACFEDTRFNSYQISVNNNSFTAEGGVLYNKSKNCIIAFPPAKESFTIPETVSEIYRYAFEGSMISTIRIPKTVSIIGKNAFKNSLLKNVTFDSDASVSIGAGAFYQDWQDPDKKPQYVGPQYTKWGGIAQVYVSESTYKKSSAFFAAGDETACFTPFVPKEESEYNYPLGCDVFVVPEVTVSGVPQTWVSSANLNCYWDNTSYYTIRALYLDGNREITFDEGTNASNSIEVKEKGEYTLTIQYENKTGTMATAFMKVVLNLIDSGAPSEVTYTMVDDVCYLHSYDTESGIDQIKYTVNNSDVTNYNDGFTLEPGDNVVRAWAIDNVGNANAVKEYVIHIAGQQRSISLNKTARQLTKGKCFQLNVSFQPDNFIDKTISYSSSDMSIATVSSDGVVTGKQVGYAVITATANGGYTAKCAVVVTKDPSVKKKVSLYKAGTYKLRINNLRSDYDVTYSSDDKSVCKVNSNGKITGVGLGECTIITKVDTGVRVYRLETVVTVGKPVVKITTKPGSIKVGSSYTFKAYRRGISSNVQWSTSNKSVATINKTTGKVIAQKRGTTTITAKAGKYKCTYKLKVK